MKRLICLATALVLLAGTILPAAASAQAMGKSKYQFEMYHVVIVKQGPNWKPYGTEESMAVQEQMVAGVQQAADEGILVSGGLVQDGTDVELIFIFRIENYADALDIINSSPSIRSGFYRAEIYPWFAPKGLEPDPPVN